MVRRQSMPIQAETLAAAAATLLFFAWTAPAFAASSSNVDCDDVSERTLELPASELKLGIISHEVDAKTVSDPDTENNTLSPIHLLAPRVEAVLREVFEDTTAPHADSDEPENQSLPVMNARVPGVSDIELARYKRQMFRRDI